MINIICGVVFLWLVVYVFGSLHKSVYICLYQDSRGKFYCLTLLKLKIDIFVSCVRNKAGNNVFRFYFVGTV